MSFLNNLSPYDTIYENKQAQLHADVMRKHFEAVFAARQAEQRQAEVQAARQKFMLEFLRINQPELYKTLSDAADAHVVMTGVKGL